jgi:1-acyl-sn-glycerol-3-phosphate acyltransferase
MSSVDRAWQVGRLTLVPLTKFVAPFRIYGGERVPLEGGLVMAANHFSWIDPPMLGSASPRVVYFMAKVEAWGIPGLQPLLRSFGAFPVRRGESDREAVRTMRRIVKDGHALGLFVEGTRQSTRDPGTVQPGAAMVAINESVPVIPAVIHGTQDWRLGNFHRSALAWGEPMTFGGLPPGGKGYKEASRIIEAKVREIWGWLVEMESLGFPRDATPPR